MGNNEKKKKQEQNRGAVRDTIARGVKTYLKKRKAKKAQSVIMKIFNLKKIALVASFSVAIIFILGLLALTLGLVGSFNPGSKSKTMYDFSRDIDVQSSINLLRLNTVDEYNGWIDKAKKGLAATAQNRSILDSLIAGKGKLEGSLIDYYDSKAGFQILLDDALILQQLERLSYAFLYPEWRPSYDYTKVVDTEIKELEKQMTNDKTYSKIGDYLEKKLELSELFMIYNKYHEMVREIVSHFSGYLVGGVHEYQKDFYGEETQIILKPNLSFHSIVNTEAKYEKGYYEGDEVEALFQKSVALNGEKEMTVTTVPLQDLEYAYRLGYRRIHMDATFENMYYQAEEEAKSGEPTDRSKTLENKLTDKEIFIDHIIETIRMRLPIFEYITYDSAIVGNTFYADELYQPSAFDERGDRNFSEAETASIKKNMLDLAKSNVYNISFADVIENRLSKEAYKENYERLENALLFRSGPARIYEPRNHNVVVKNSAMDDHYILYNGEYVDSYSEDILVRQNTSTGELSAEVTVSFKKSSLKPSAIRTNEADIDYIYSKVENRMTYPEILERLETERLRNPGSEIVTIAVRNYGEVLYSIASRSYSIDVDKLEEKENMNQMKNFSPEKANFGNPLKNGSIAKNEFGLLGNTGVRILAREGEDVKAVADGMVVEKKDKMVLLKHDNGLYTVYANLGTVKNIKAGTKIKKGGVLGTVGKGTGGAYLTFEIRTANDVQNAVCPIPYLHLQNATAHQSCLVVAEQRYECDKNSEAGYPKEYVLGE